MEVQATSRKLVPFSCPVCAAPNEVGLVALARAGSVACTGCKRKLSAADVSRAMHAPRTAPPTKPGFHISGQRRFTTPGVR